MTDISRDELFQLLSSARRRYAIHALYRAGGESDVPSLAAAVARAETGGTATDDLRRVHSSLTATHLPRLAAAGVVEYDGDRVALTPGVRRHGLIGRTRPATNWPLLYGTLGAFVFLLTLALAGGLLPVALVTYEAVTLGAVACVLGLSAVRYLGERRARAPPETFDALVE
jgi:hypothetical protein